MSVLLVICYQQELNRVRRAAISLGFMSLVDGLAAILERECTLLPGGAHPDCALQLTHAANVLRKPYSRDPKYNVLPMRTRFQEADNWSVLRLEILENKWVFTSLCHNLGEITV